MTYVWCEFVCVICAKTTSGNFTTGKIPHAWMKREAEAKGWKFANDAECACSQACFERYIADRDVS